MVEIPDPFRFYVAVTPLALYLLVIGAMHLGRRPRLVGGMRDTLALMLAVSGLLAVGPLELFLPEHAATRFGALAWLLMMGLYVLVTVLALTGQRPQWVLYHLAPEQAFAALESACRAVDDQYVAAGNTLYLPQSDTELRIAAGRIWRATVVSAARSPSLTVWRQLESNLARSLREIESRPTWIGPMLVVAALALWLAAGWRAVDNPLAFARACREMLRL